jgi:hypothetical protein
MVWSSTSPDADGPRQPVQARIKAMNGKAAAYAKDSRKEVSTRSHLIFVAIGVAIVIGGLWMLYQFDAPYHPEVPVTDSQQLSTSGS